MIFAKSRWNPQWNDDEDAVQISDTKWNSLWVKHTLLTPIILVLNRLHYIFGATEWFTLSCIKHIHCTNVSDWEYCSIWFVSFRFVLKNQRVRSFSTDLNTLTVSRTHTYTSCQSETAWIHKRQVNFFHLQPFQLSEKTIFSLLMHTFRFLIASRFVLFNLYLVYVFILLFFYINFNK